MSQSPRQILERFRKAQFMPGSGDYDKVLEELERYYSLRFEKAIKPSPGNMEEESMARSARQDWQRSKP